MQQNGDPVGEIVEGKINSGNLDAMYPAPGSVTQTLTATEEMFFPEFGDFGERENQSNHRAVEKFDEREDVYNLEFRSQGRERGPDETERNIAIPPGRGN